ETYHTSLVLKVFGWATCQSWASASYQGTLFFSVVKLLSAVFSFFPAFPASQRGHGPWRSTGSGDPSIHPTISNVVAFLVLRANKGQRGYQERGPSRLGPSGLDGKHSAEGRPRV